MKKKILKTTAMLLSLAMCLALVACSNTAPAADTPAPATEVPASTAPTENVPAETETVEPAPEEPTETDPALFGYETLDDGTLELTEWKGSGIADIIIPAAIDGVAVTVIGEYLFKGDTAIETLVIPEGVVRVKSGYLNDAVSLKSVSVPSTVTEMPAIFSYSKDYALGFEGFNVAEGNPSYAAVDGVLFSADMATLLRCPLGKTGEYVVPNSVVNINTNAFAHTQLTSIVINEGCEYIQDNCFRDSVLLESVKLPETLVFLGNCGFLYCSKLNNVVWPASLTKMENDMFSGCSSLSNVTIPEGVTVIGSGAFADCGGLTEIVLPSTLTELGKNAFRGCAGLTVCDIPKGCTVGENVFLDTPLN